MDTNTLSPKIAAAALVSAGSAECEFDGVKLRHKLETFSMLAGLIHQGMKIEDFKWYLSFHEENGVKLQLRCWRRHAPRSSVHP
jgi:hypothetical protein